MGDSDYRRFCLHCGWLDEDYGCISPYGEAVWQCPMYQHYHPEEVEQFNLDMEEWAKQKGETHADIKGCQNDDNRS